MNQRTRKSESLMLRDQLLLFLHNAHYYLFTWRRFLICKLSLIVVCIILFFWLFGPLFCFVVMIVLYICQPVLWICPGILLVGYVIENNNNNSSRNNDKPTIVRTPLSLPALQQTHLLMSLRSSSRTRHSARGRQGSGAYPSMQLGGESGLHPTLVASVSLGQHVGNKHSHVFRVANSPDKHVVTVDIRPRVR